MPKMGGLIPLPCPRVASRIVHSGGPFCMCRTVWWANLPLATHTRKGLSASPVFETFSSTCGLDEVSLGPEDLLVFPSSKAKIAGRDSEPQPAAHDQAAARPGWGERSELFLSRLEERGTSDTSCAESGSRRDE